MSSLSPELQAKAQKNWQEIFRPSFAKMKKQIDQTQGFRILSMSPPDDSVIIDLYSKGRQRARQYSFQKIGDEWKIDFAGIPNMTHIDLALPMYQAMKKFADE